MAREQAAPEDAVAELLRAFVNTLDLDRGTDALADGGAAQAWLADAGLAAPTGTLGEAEHDRVLGTREAFRAMLVAHAEHGRADEAVEFLNRVADDGGLTLCFSGPARAALDVTCGGLEGVLEELAAIELRAAQDGVWERLKACPADGCHWAFYDASRNRSSRWCDMGTCGNRSKRASRRAVADGGPRA